MLQCHFKELCRFEGCKGRISASGDTVLYFGPLSASLKVIPKNLLGELGGLTRTVEKFSRRCLKIVFALLREAYSIDIILYNNNIVNII